METWKPCCLIFKQTNTMFRASIFNSQSVAKRQTGKHVPTHRHTDTKTHTQTYTYGDLWCANKRNKNHSIIHVSFGNISWFESLNFPYHCRPTSTHVKQITVWLLSMPLKYNKIFPAVSCHWRKGKKDCIDVTDLNTICFLEHIHMQAARAFAAVCMFDIQGVA